MKKIKLGFLFLVVLISCNNSKTPKDNSHFDKEKGLLEIEYTDNPDSYLAPILRYSKIHDKGYGLLLNIENAISTEKQNAILNGFRKRDINAIHVFKVKNGTLPENTRIAMEGARFIWVFMDRETSYPLCGYLKPHFKKLIKNGGVIVVEKDKVGGIKQCMED